MSKADIIDFKAVQVARESREPCSGREKPEVIDLDEARLDRGLLIVPVTFEDHVDQLTTKVHTLVFLAINASPTEGEDVLAGVDAGPAFDAADELRRAEPADADQTREFREQLAALTALIEKLMPWCEIGFRNGSVRRVEAEEARDEALRLIRRLETFCEVSGGGFR